MTRILFILAAVVTVAAAARPAAADDAPVLCGQEVDRSVRITLGTSLAPGTSIVCRGGSPTTRNVNGSADSTEHVFADVALADGRTATIEVTTKGSIVATSYAHVDTDGSDSKLMALVFWVFALVSVGGALFVVTRRNLIAAVMGMVGSFLGIAAIYMMLYAQFLAVVQMLVYAGAIMVLFVFVVMILNRPEDEPVAPSGRAGQALGGLAILYLVGRLIFLLMDVQPPNAEVARAAPPIAEHCVEWANKACTRMASYDWGSVRSVGTDLFGPGLFPFEAISILLLLAVVGAIAIAKPVHVDDDAPARTREEGAA